MNGPESQVATSFPAPLDTPKPPVVLEQGKIVARTNPAPTIGRLLESSAHPMWLLDPGGKVLEANRAALAAAGDSREAAVGALFWQTAGWNHSPEVEAAVSDAVRQAADGVRVRIESRQRRADASVADVELILQPVWNEAGELINLLPEVWDITARKHDESAMQEARQSAAEAAAKDRLLAMLSHELRTPLAPVLISVSAMEGDPMLPESLRREIAMVRRNVEIESRLIDDLLDLSRIAGGTVALQCEAVDLNEAMRNVCTICRAPALEKNLRLEVRLDPDVGRAQADPARLQQVMWNLLKNAIAFTPHGGTVAVNTFKNEECVGFQVRDTGVGIEPGRLQRIFDAFEPGAQAGARKSAGLGLGLAISKSLVELHGGRIVGQSGGPGRGATFTVEIPCAAAATAPEPARSAAPHARRRLLLVEDHEDTAAALARFLRMQGYQVHTASHAAEALRILDAEDFDLVLSDIGLPDASGHQLMRTIRDRWGIKGIAMSGFGKDEDIRMSRESGFSEHLVKPMKMKLLEAALQRLLEGNA